MDVICRARPSCATGEEAYLRAFRRLGTSRWCLVVSEGRGHFVRTPRCRALASLLRSQSQHHFTGRPSRCLIFSDKAGPIF